MALLFNDERAKKAVLSFLREAKVEQMVTIPPRDRQAGEERAEPREREGVEGEEGSQGPLPEIAKGRGRRRGPPLGRGGRRGGAVFRFLAFWYAGMPHYDGRTPLRRGLYVGVRF